MVISRLEISVHLLKEFLGADIGRRGCQIRTDHCTAISKTMWNLPELSRAIHDFAVFISINTYIIINLETI